MGLRVCKLLGVNPHQMFDVYSNEDKIAEDVYIDERRIFGKNISSENLFYVLGKLVLGQARLVVKDD